MVSALLMGNFEAAVEMCLTEDRMAEAILLAIAGGPELLLRTQKKYFQRNKSNLSRVGFGLLFFLSSDLSISLFLFNLARGCMIASQLPDFL